MPAFDSNPWTRAAVLALPDDGSRYELVEGALLVSPAPRFRHQHAVGLLYLALAPFVEEVGLGVTGLAPADLSFGGPQLVQPDLFVVALPDDSPPDDWADFRVPTLVVEVLSPATVGADRWTKRGLYQRAGVAEYWIVDCDARHIERWRPEQERPELVTGSITWQPDSTRTALTIDLATYFDRVWRGR